MDTNFNKTHRKEFYQHNILMIGKNPSQQNKLKSVLESKHFKTFQAYSFKRANTLIQQNHFAGIIIVVHQSFDDVLRYVKSVRKHEDRTKHPKLGIVVTAEFDDRKSIPLGLRDGVDDFFIGNQDVSLLERRLTYLIERNFYKFQINLLEDEHVKKRA